MEHRIELSTTLLIAVRAKNRKGKQAPAVAGIAIDKIPASTQEKSRHLVDALGNIVPATSRHLALS